MPWVKCSERMPDISDKTSVDASNCFVVRFPLPDNNWEIGVMREKDFDKFGIPSSNYEWFEGLLDEEPKPTRQEIVDIVKETIEGSIPYVVRHYAFLITADSWTCDYCNKEFWLNVIVHYAWSATRKKVE